MENHWDEREFRTDGLLLQTSGDGLWSSRQIPVPIKRITMKRLLLRDFGEISQQLHEFHVCLYFDTDVWDVRRDGLIYTDNQFEREARVFIAPIYNKVFDVVRPECGHESRTFCVNHQKKVICTVCLQHVGSYEPSMAGMHADKKLHVACVDPDWSVFGYSEQGMQGADYVHGVLGYW